MKENIMKKYFLPIFAILLITGCSNPPREESSRMTLGLVQSVVEKGVNQTEIIKTLGAPNIISKDKQGRETWTYDRISQESLNKSRAGFGFGGLFGWLWGGTSSKSTSTRSTKSLTAIITFDNSLELQKTFSNIPYKIILILFSSDFNIFSSLIFM